jgi:hypothetical protein
VITLEGLRAELAAAVALVRHVVLAPHGDRLSGLSGRQATRHL